MKFSCKNDTILEAFQTTAKAASSKSTIPALEGLLLELTGNTLVITGYNLEIGIRTEIEVAGSENGSSVINARTICDITRKMPSGIIQFDITEGKDAKISCGSAEFSIACTRSDEYPTIPDISLGHGFTLSQPVLKSMINQTKYACATVDTKPAFMGCKFEIKDKVLSVVATDTVRVALRQESVDFEDIDFIVPSKTLDELTRILSDNKDDNVTVSIEKNQVSFEVGKYIMISRLINGDFLDYKKFMTCNESVYAEVKCSEIIEMLDRALLVINEKNRLPIRCEFSADSLAISCSSTVGKINDKINIKYYGEPITIGFNGKFLLDAFRACDIEEAKVILTGSSNSHILIVPKDNRNFTFLLVPMRLR